MKGVKILIKMVILLTVFAPTISPLVVNAQIPIEEVKEEREKVKKEIKDSRSKGMAKNVAYGKNDSNSEDNGVGIIDFTIPKIVSMEYKINALTHEVILQIGFSNEISLSDDYIFDMTITDGIISTDIDETNIESDSTPGYIKSIDDSATTDIYEYEISTGALEDLGFSREGQYTIGFKQYLSTDSSVITYIPIYTSAGDKDEINIEVPKTIEVDGEIYGEIGDSVNSTSDVDNISDVEKITPDTAAASTIDASKQAYGIYELESIGYEENNGEDDDTNSSTPKVTDWTENDLTLAKYDHIIRPSTGNYLIADNIDATVTNDESKKLDKEGGWSSLPESGTDNINDGFRPIGQPIDSTRPTGDFRGKITGDVDTILSSPEDNTYIKNLYIYEPSRSNIGLVALSRNAKFENFGLVDAKVEGENIVGALGGHLMNTTILNVYALESESDNASDIVGRGISGGIVGAMSAGSISSDGRFSGEIPGWIDNGESQPNLASSDRDGYKTFNTLDVETSLSKGGGIVGSASQTLISNVYNKGTIDVGSDLAGGIAGDISDGSIINSYNSGSIKGFSELGGIVGRALGNTVIESVYNKGNIENDNSEKVGGIIGNIVGAGYPSLINVYNQGAISGYMYVGGIVGYGSESITNAYNMGRITVLKDTANEYAETPYVGGIVGRPVENIFTSSPIASTLTNVFSAGDVVYEIQTDKVEQYVGDVIGRPYDEAATLLPTFTSVYSLDEIKLPASSDLDYPITKKSISETSVSSFWTTDLGFTTGWNTSTIAPPSPDSDTSDESSDDDVYTLIDDLGYYAQLKESRSDGVEVEIPEQVASPYYRDIVDYKINAMTLDITIKYQNINALDISDVTITLSDQDKLRSTNLVCPPVENIQESTLTLSGKDCDIQPDTEYKITIDGLLNGDIYLYLHTPKQYIDDNGTPVISDDDTTYALIGDGINVDTYQGTEGSTAYANPNGASMPSTVNPSTLDPSKQAYGIYELESICYEEVSEGVTYEPVNRKENVWTENDLTLSKYDHVVRPCDGNYMIVGDVDASATNEGEDPANYKVDKDGGFSQWEDYNMIKLVNNGFNPIGLSNVVEKNSEKTIISSFKLIGTTDENGTEGMVHIYDFYINTTNNCSGLIANFAGEAKNIGMENVDIKGDTKVSGLVAIQQSKSVISNVYSTGDIVGIDQVGGLIGFIAVNATLSNAYSSANVTGTNTVGGLVGTGNVGGGLTSYVAQINNVFSAGNVQGVKDVGGLMGSALHIDLKNSYSVSNVTGEENVGGLIGNFERMGNNASIENTYAGGDVVGKENVGGLIGYNIQTGANDIIIKNSYSAGDVYADTYEVGGLIGYNAMNEAYLANSYAYEGQKVYRGDIETVQVIGTDNDTDNYNKYVTYEDIITENFYTTTLGWDMTNIWISSDYNYHPHLIGSSIFPEYEAAQINVEKLDMEDLLETQEIVNYKIDANTDSIYLLLGDTLRGNTKSTSLDVSVTPDSGYTGGGISTEKVRVSDTNSLLYIDGPKYQINPDSIYTVEVTNSSLGISGSFKIHTPLKGADGYIPIGSAGVSSTYVSGDIIDTTTVDPEDKVDSYSLYELESICYDHTQDSSLVWTEDDLTLTKYDHVIRPCDANYKLVDDVDMTDVNQTTTMTLDKDGGWSTDTDGDEIADKNDGFRPITYFSGLFEGNDKVINNLYINDSEMTNVGLFGQVVSYNNSPGTVRNLNVANVDILGKQYVGGLVGDTEGANLDNIQVSGNVVGLTYTGGMVGFSTSSNITNVSSTVNVELQISEATNGKNYIGGLIGYAYTSPIDNSYATGEVNGRDANYVGGLIGRDYSCTVTNSYAMGDVTGKTTVGGFVGDKGGNSGSISNSYATGNVTGIDKVGGFIGNGISITKSYSTGDVTGETNVGGFAGTTYDLSAVYTTSDVIIDTDVAVENVGGLVGEITSSSSGGLQHSYAANSVDVTSSISTTNVGGLVGHIENSNAKVLENYTVNNLEITSPIIDNVGGAIGYAERIKTGTSIFNNISISDITYPTSSISTNPSEHTPYIGSFAGVVADSYKSSLVNNYVYENQTANGEILDANQYVGNDILTDPLISSYDIYSASQDNFSDPTWYTNSDYLNNSGNGVSFFDAYWDAPYTEDAKVCLPHLYEDNEAGTYVPNQECIEIVSLYIADFSTLNTVHVSSLQKQNQYITNINSQSDKSQDELIIDEEEESDDNILYPALKEYFDTNGYGYSIFESKVMSLNNARINTILSKIDEAQQNNSNFINNNLDKIDALVSVVMNA